MTNHTFSMVKSGIMVFLSIDCLIIFRIIPCQSTLAPLDFDENLYILSISTHKKKRQSLLHSIM